MPAQVDGVLDVQQRFFEIMVLQSWHSKFDETDLSNSRMKKEV